MGICNACGSKTGLLSTYKAYDGSICADCVKLSKSYKAETIEKIKAYREIENERKALFNPTQKLKSFNSIIVLIDNSNKLFQVGNSPIYKFDELINFYSEQVVGSTVVTTKTKKKGGLTRAVVGGVIAGPVGALVGAGTAGSVSTSTQSTNTITKYYYDTNTYSGYEKHEILPPKGFNEFALYCINYRNNEINTNKPNDKLNNNSKLLPEVDPISEIKKYKQLLDDGLLTQDEFEKKKKEILNPESNIRKEQEQNSLNNKTTNIPNNQNINKKNSNEPQKLGQVNVVISWIFFAFFALGALGSLTSGFNFANLIIYALIALICCPPVIEKIQETTKIKITTPMRIIAILVLLMISGIAMTANYKPTTNTSGNTNSQQVIGNNQNQENPVFVSNTDGKDFFQNILCGNTQCEYKEPMRLKADDMIPYDIVTYTTGNATYSFKVTTNTKNEIANVQMFFFKYGTEDPTNYFMTATRLNYPNSNVAQLTLFITENIGKDQKIKIGDFTFHIYNGTSDNCVILDIYTDEFAKINGNP